MKTTWVLLGAVLVLGAYCLGQATTQPSVPDLKTEWKMVKMDEAKAKDWLAAWDKNISGEAKGYRTCDKAVGEDIAWTVTPIMEGFCYGYKATGDTKYLDMWVDWTDSLIKRAVKEPDGFVGWPGKDPHGTEVDKLSRLFGDSMLSEAMAFRPVVILCGQVRKSAALKEKYGAKAESYLKFAQQLAEKWEKRGGWRETKDGGMISVVTYYGIKDPNAAKWEWSGTEESRKDPNLAFSHPGNKANHVARWMLAMSDVTGNPDYRDRAEKWFKLLKSRMKQKQDGTYTIWNYWQAAGPWDYQPDGKTKHGEWVHPKGGYYEIDVLGIVDAYEHGLVFTRKDIDSLIATAKAEKRYWSALTPYSPEIQAEFEKNMKPEGWGGLSGAPRYLWAQNFLFAGGAK